VARSALTSQPVPSAAIGGDIDIGKSILGQATFRAITQIATNCRRAPIQSVEIIGAGDASRRKIRN
jgi:hypothetical protein